jgi:hypothetical protein
MHGDGSELANWTGGCDITVWWRLSLHNNGVLGISQEHLQWRYSLRAMEKLLALKSPLVSLSQALFIFNVYKTRSMDGGLYH